ncbi:MAG: 4a-hydroxytetrahydrobiopterin dehydratase [Alphaproteobacteria bacterium]
MGLTAKSCVPCRGGIPPLLRDDAEKFLNETPDWTLSDDADRIERKYSFSNFAQAMAFAVKIGELAESEGHHPDLGVGWGYCTVLLYTHKIKGLHENDFIMAAKIDALG